jgi:hypothetical protein
MTVTRTQGIERISATAVNAAFTTFDIPRPQTTPAAVAYAENTDHVIKEPALREFESGHCVVELGAILTAANVWLDKVEIVKLLPTAQKGLSSLSSSGLNSPPGANPPLFPSGAPSDETLVRVLVDRANANDLATNEDAVLGFLGSPDFSNTVRSYPGITLRSGEFVRVTLGNTSGGDLTDTITATYKLGLNQSDTGKP